MRIGLAGVGRIGKFHAQTLLGLDFVDELIVTDPQHDQAAAVAAELGVRQVPDTDALLGESLDGFVIAAATTSHTELIRAGVAAGVPTFCEKPVAASLEETLALAREESNATTPVHIGFQRRFDIGYRRLQQACADGELGFVHTIRASTSDQTPPPAAYIPHSGGIFRDCNVHDYDAIRFVTGREVATAYAVGSNKGESFFAEAGDVDTGASLLTLDDGTLVQVTSTRYNGQGHDVRMEVCGSKGALTAGLDDRSPLRSAQPQVDFPPGLPYLTFMERFQPAYVAELTAFADVARGERPSPCTIADAAQAFRTAEACERSRAEGRVVPLAEVENV